MFFKVGNTPPRDLDYPYNSDTYFNESGRSLTEMLATLAIVGVLSVGGLWAFNRAMDRNKANTLVYEAGKRATIVMSQILAGNTTPSLLDFTDNTFSGGEFDKEVVRTKLKGQFGIKVNGVSKSVCEDILNTIGNNTPLRRLSWVNLPNTPITYCSDTNDYLFIYNDEMGTKDTVQPAKECRNDSECETECATCQIADGEEVGICIGECESACEVGDDCGENDCVVCDSETKTCQNKCDEVDYLESTGTQYIDTNTEITPTTTILIDASLESYVRWSNSCGGIPSASGYYCLPFGWTDSNTRARSIYGTDIVGTGEYQFNYTLGQRIKLLYNDNKKLYIDDVHVFTFNYDKQTPPSTQIFQFGRYSNACGAKFYGVKIWDNGYNSTLVADFIPVLSPQIGEEERKACMFDKVSKKLFCGTGTFDYGPKN